MTRFFLRSSHYCHESASSHGSHPGVHKGLILASIVLGHAGRYAANINHVSRSRHHGMAHYQWLSPASDTGTKPSACTKITSWADKSALCDSGFGIAVMLIITLGATMETIVASNDIIKHKDYHDNILAKTSVTRATNDYFMQLNNI